MKRVLVLLGIVLPVLLHFAVVESSRVFLALALGIAAFFAFLALARLSGSLRFGDMGEGTMARLPAMPCNSPTLFIITRRLPCDHF